MTRVTQLATAAAPSDGGGNGAGATLIFTAPEVMGEIVDSDEDLILIIHPSALLANDRTHNANGVLTVSAVGEAAHGTVTLLPSGEIAFYPEANYFGRPRFATPLPISGDTAVWVR